MRISGTDLYIPQGDTTELILIFHERPEGELYLFKDKEIISKGTVSEKTNGEEDSFYEVSFEIRSEHTLTPGRFFYDVFIFEQDPSNYFDEEVSIGIGKTVNLEYSLIKESIRKINIDFINFSPEGYHYPYQEYFGEAVIQGSPTEKWRWEDHGTYFKLFNDQGHITFKFYYLNDGEYRPGDIVEFSTSIFIPEIMFGLKVRGSNYKKVKLQTFIRKSLFIVEEGLPQKENSLKIFTGKNPEEI